MTTPSRIDDITAKDDKIQGPGATTVSFEGKPPTLIGDKTIHGETVTGPGSSTVTSGGKFLALIGDKTTAVVRKNRSTTWGPGPITSPGAPSISIGK